MSTLKFNIGLVSSKTGEVIEAGHALKQLFAYLDEPITSLHSLKIARSDTEDTLVVGLAHEVKDPRPFTFTDNVFALADALEQDCIAVYNPTNDHGGLIGPNAKKWGAFDKSKFIE